MNPKKVLSENQQHHQELTLVNNLLLIQLSETMSYVPQLYEHVKGCFVA